MPFDPFERIPVGRTGLAVTRLAFGSASIGGLFRPVPDADAAAVAGHAWALGIRYFDTAPLYGYGAAERRLGALLADRPRDAYVLSSKVGRLVRGREAVGPADDVDRQAVGGAEDAYYRDVGERRIVFDYSADGVRRSIEESLERLGLDRLDIAYIHDPDRHRRAAIGEAYPALDRLRAEGVLRAIGAGMNQAPMLARFAREADLDIILAANRYTLLDQSALDELLPEAARRGIAIAIGGVMNSGILADPRPGAPYLYQPAPPAVVERAARIRAVCERHEVPVREAAIQFPLAHPAVVTLIAGVRRVAHLDDYPRAMRRPIPADLWAELRSEGLLREDAPVPA